jgi:hypothetical protein
MKGGGVRIVEGGREDEGKEEADGGEERKKERSSMAFRNLYLR